MTLLELITEASLNAQTLNAPPDYPVVLNPDSIFLKLNPKADESVALTLPIPVDGWEISQTDSELMTLCKKFFAEIEGKLKNPDKFRKEEFLGILKSFLESIKETLDLPIKINLLDSEHVRILVEKLGFFGKDVASLILEASVIFGMWEFTEALIVNGLVKNSCYKALVPKLVEIERSDLLCLCVKHALDLQSPELVLILRRFLSGNGDGCVVSVRNEWERQAVLAIEKATDRTITGKKLKEAKDAAVLLTVAHDGFSSLELCLHNLLASSNLDEVVWSSSIRKLNGKEMMRLIRYLGKWLKKYERFPQAVPCPKASALFGLTACDWVPKLKDVARCLSLVIDESFSALVLHPEFHEELILIDSVVGSLALEAKFCCCVANVAEKLKLEAQGN